jgi:hypothetical protein
MPGFIEFTCTKPKGNIGSVEELVRIYHILRQYSINLENEQVYRLRVPPELFSPKINNIMFFFPF